MRGAQEIRESGCAWVSEAELNWLCTSLLELAAALRKYGSHPHACLAGSAPMGGRPHPPPCTCGFDAVLSAADAKGETA